MSFLARLKPKPKPNPTPKKRPNDGPDGPDGPDSGGGKKPNNDKDGNNNIKDKDKDGNNNPKDKNKDGTNTSKNKDGDDGPASKKDHDDVQGTFGKKDYDGVKGKYSDAGVKAASKLKNNKMAMLLIGAGAISLIAFIPFVIKSKGNVPEALFNMLKETTIGRIALGIFGLIVCFLAYKLARIVWGWFPSNSIEDNRPSLLGTQGRFRAP